MEKLDARAQIMKIVESMPDYHAAVILAYMQALQKTLEEDARKLKSEAIYRHMLTVPEEDYELTAEEKASLEQGRKDIREGRYSTFEQVAEELDI